MTLIPLEVVDMETGLNLASAGYDSEESILPNLSLKRRTYTDMSIKQWHNAFSKLVETQVKFQISKFGVICGNHRCVVRLYKLQFCP